MNVPQLSPDAQAQLAKLSMDLANNPKTRKQFVGLVKEIDPSRRFPDVEVDDIRDSVKKEFETRDMERQKEQATARLEAQKNSLRDKYSDEQIGEIEKLMEKEGIANYATAAKLYAADLAPADPTSNIKSGVFELPKFDMKNINNIRQDSTKRAYEVVGELMKRRGHR